MDHSGGTTGSYTSFKQPADEGGVGSDDSDYEEGEEDIGDDDLEINTDDDDDGYKANELSGNKRFLSPGDSPEDRSANNSKEGAAETAEDFGDLGDLGESKEDGGSSDDSAEEEESEDIIKDDDGSYIAPTNKPKYDNPIITYGRQAPSKTDVNWDTLKSVQDIRSGSSRNGSAHAIDPFKVTNKIPEQRRSDGYDSMLKDDLDQTRTYTQIRSSPHSAHAPPPLSPPPPALSSSSRSTWGNPLSNSFSSSFSSGNPESSSKFSGVEDEEAAENENQKGNRFFKAAMYLEAIKCYKRAIELNPSNAKLYSNKAQAHLKCDSNVPHNSMKFTQHCEEAIKLCNKSLELDFKYEKSYFRRGKANSILGKLTEACQDFAYCLYFNKDNQDAIDNFEQCESKYAKFAQMKKINLKEMLSTAEEQLNIKMQHSLKSSHPPANRSCIANSSPVSSDDASASTTGGGGGGNVPPPKSSIPARKVPVSSVSMPASPATSYHSSMNYSSNSNSNSMFTGSSNNRITVSYPSSYSSINSSSNNNKHTIFSDDDDDEEDVSSDDNDNNSNNRNASSINSWSSNRATNYSYPYSNNSGISSYSSGYGEDRSYSSYSNSSYNKSPNELKQEGKEAAQKGDHHKAIKIYSAALDKDEHFYLALVLRAVSFLEINKFEECIGDADLVLKEFDKTNLKALLYRVKARLGLCELIDRIRYDNDDSDNYTKSPLDRKSAYLHLAQSDLDLLHSFKRTEESEDLLDRINQQLAELADLQTV